MVYEIQEDLKTLKSQARWTDRELANVLGVSPSAVRSKLNGFLRLTEQERTKLETAMLKRIGEMSNAD